MLINSTKAAKLYYSPSYAKINLYCDVFKKDNYEPLHKMDTWMHRISLKDDCYISYLPEDSTLNQRIQWKSLYILFKNKAKNVYVEKYGKLKCYFFLSKSSDYHFLEYNFWESKNTIRLALKNFLDICEDKDISISGKMFFYIHKNIPRGAGLGGGSANAATMLQLLHFIFFNKQAHEHSPLDDTALSPFKIVKNIGHDCIFLLREGSYRMINYGDTFAETKMPVFSNLPILLVYDYQKQDTKEAFSILDKNFNEIKVMYSSNNLSKIIQNFNNNVNFNYYLHNTFFQLLPRYATLTDFFNKELPEIFNFYSLHLTGSGSSYYFLPKQQDIEEKTIYKFINSLKKILDNEGYIYLTYLINPKLRIKEITNFYNLIEEI